MHSREAPCGTGLCEALSFGPLVPCLVLLSGLMPSLLLFPFSISVILSFLALLLPILCATCSCLCFYFNHLTLHCSHHGILKCFHAQLSPQHSRISSPQQPAHGLSQMLGQNPCPTDGTPTAATEVRDRRKTVNVSLALPQSPMCSSHCVQWKVPGLLREMFQSQEHSWFPAQRWQTLLWNWLCL